MDGNVVFDVPATVAESLTAIILDENRCSSSDSVHNSDQHFSFKSKCDSVSGSNVEFLSGSFLLGDQFMSMFCMSEHVVSDGLKSTRGTIALNPHQHFAEMDQFVLNNSLHSRQSVAAIVATDSYLVSRRSKRLKQKSR